MHVMLRRRRPVRVTVGCAGEQSLPDLESIDFCTDLPQRTTIAISDYVSPDVQITSYRAGRVEGYQAAGLRFGELYLL